MLQTSASTLTSALVVICSRLLVIFLLVSLQFFGWTLKEYVSHNFSTATIPEDFPNCNFTVVNPHVCSCLVRNLVLNFLARLLCLWIHCSAVACCDVLKCPVANMWKTLLIQTVLTSNQFLSSFVVDSCYFFLFPKAFSARKVNIWTSFLCCFPVILQLYQKCCQVASLMGNPFLGVSLKPV